MDATRHIKKIITRRNFIKKAGAGSALLVLPCFFDSCRTEPERPNILWITSEDNSPFLGCYGDRQATTPNLDRLAAEGILYENAFATAPVCAPARNSIITGMYPNSLGTEHMRSNYRIPEMIKFFPQYLRNTGYYCTNDSKEDYNTAAPNDIWDESSDQATYKNRAPHQPFFAVFNIETSHESTIHQPSDHLRHDPAKVKLPDYHPDTPEIRHDWAHYYDQVEEMDGRVGKILAELKNEGLSENTIVFYYADNGGVLCRSKRFCYDSGLRIPFILRVPPKFRYLAPDKPGTRTDRIISFVDLAPTMLSLANIPVPTHMQGKAFLGPQAGEPREYACSFRGRMDERYDMVRTVRDMQFRYIRNYMPHRIYGQHIEYLWKAAATQSWERMYREGKCDRIQRLFWEPKPAEELYDLKADPHEVNNLADSPEYQDILLKMRKACLDWQRDIRDTGFIPEGEMVELDRRQKFYDFARSEAYDLDRIMETAHLATVRDIEHLPELMKRLGDEDKFVRYWAVTGVLILAEKAEPSAAALLNLLEDSSADVRITAAEALCRLSDEQWGMPILVKELANENVRIALHAANALECLGERARPVLAALKAASRSGDTYVARAARYTAAKFGT